jgi:chemotaxis response regulator CheB
MESFRKFIIVIGTSAGGFRALEDLLVQFTPEMNAAFLWPSTFQERG